MSELDRNDEQMRLAPNFADFAEEISARYRNTWCVVYISQPDMELVLFGPFRDGAEASEWIRTKLPFGVRCTVIPLRRTDSKQTKEIIYTPSRLLKSEEYATSNNEVKA